MDASLRAAVTKVMTDAGWSVESADNITIAISDDYLLSLHGEHETDEGDVNDSYGMIADQTAEGAAEVFHLFPELVEPLRTFLTALGNAAIAEGKFPEKFPYVPHDVKEAGLTDAYLAEQGR